MPHDGLAQKSPRHDATTHKNVCGSRLALCTLPVHIPFFRCCRHHLLLQLTRFDWLCRALQFLLPLRLPPRRCSSLLSRSHHEQHVSVKRLSQDSVFTRSRTLRPLAQWTPHSQRLDGSERKSCRQGRDPRLARPLTPNRCERSSECCRISGYFRSFVSQGAHITPTS